MEERSRDSSSKPQNLHLLQRIKGFTRSLLEDLCIRHCLPSVTLDRYCNYCSDPTGNCCCNSNLLNGEEILSLERESHAYRLDALLRVLLIVQTLLQDNKHLSKRDIYYIHPSVFSGASWVERLDSPGCIQTKGAWCLLCEEQQVVDRAINDICILLKCSRHNLNVVSVGKGLVMGWLRFLQAGRKFDCMRSPSTGHPIPMHVEEVEDVMCVAKYILVVEKETVFQRLANDKFCEKNHCIVITGRGYPDVSTRRFLRLLVEKLCLPAYCLVDCDPYGFDILTTYRFGSMNMAFDAKLLRVPEIRWLGVFPSDAEKYHLPDRCLLPLTPKDKNKAETMLQRCYLHREAPQWRSELGIMLQRGMKFEIEAFSVSSFSFLSDEYIPSKIQDGVYI